MKNLKTRTQPRTLQTLSTAQLAKASGGSIVMEEYGVDYSNVSFASSFAGVLSPQWGGFTIR